MTHFMEEKIKILEDYIYLHLNPSFIRCAYSALMTF